MISAHTTQVQRPAQGPFTGFRSPGLSPARGGLAAMPSAPKGFAPIPAPTFSSHQTLSEIPAHE